MSEPALPSKVSLPSRPSIVSAPEPAVITLSKESPEILSANEVPVTFSILLTVSVPLPVIKPVTKSTLIALEALVKTIWSTPAPPSKLSLKESPETILKVSSPSPARTLSTPVLSVTISSKSEPSKISTLTKVSVSPAETAVVVDKFKFTNAVKSENRSVSMSPPPSIVSDPAPPRIISLSEPPVIVSSPKPPSSVFKPETPKIVSLPSAP